jgi:hypothetical protein
VGGGGGLREVTRIVKDTCNDIEKQSVVAKLSENSSFVLHPKMIFSWGKGSYLECCLRKERNGIACLLVGVSKSKGIRRNR